MASYILDYPVHVYETETLYKVKKFNDYLIFVWSFPIEGNPVTKTNC